MSFNILLNFNTSVDGVAGLRFNHILRPSPIGANRALFKCEKACCWSGVMLRNCEIASEVLISWRFVSNIKFITATSILKVRFGMVVNWDNVRRL